MLHTPYFKIGFTGPNLPGVFEKFKEKNIFLLNKGNLSHKQVYSIHFELKSNSYSNLEKKIVFMKKLI